MEPRRGNVTCAACEDTIPCVNNYLTFGAYDDNNLVATTQITRIALTQVFKVSYPQTTLTMKISSIMNSVNLSLIRKLMIIVLIIL